MRIRRRQPFVPGHHWNRQCLGEPLKKLMHRLHCQALFAAQPKREAQQHLPDVVRSDQVQNMGDVQIQRPPLVGF